MSTVTQADPIGQIKGAFAQHKMKWADGIAERHFHFLEDSVIFADAGEVHPAQIAARLKIYAKHFGEQPLGGDERTAMQAALDAYIASSKTQQSKKPAANLDDAFPRDPEPPQPPPANPDEDTHPAPPVPEPAAEQPRRSPDTTRETPKPEIAEAAGSIDDMDDDLVGANHDTDPAIRNTNPNSAIDLKALAAKFEDSELSKDNNGYTYVTRKAVVKRLNQVVGIENWQVVFEETEDLIKCGIGIYINGAWIWKWDGAGKETEEEVKRRKSNFINAGKTWYSYAFRRAATMWGIGWYLLKK